MSKVKLNIPKTYLKICIIISILSYLIISALFRYEDTASYTVWSVNFWDLLFEGRLGDFYVYSQENLRQAPHGLFCGSYLTILPWILWNFPLYLTHRISVNAKVDSMPCIVWSKVLLLVCVIGIAFYSYKIVKDIFKKSEEQAWQAAILSVGGYEIINSTGYAGQDEVIYLVCILAAFYFLLLGKKKVYLICSCVSITICPIMLIPFLAAYLICEKKVYKIFIGTVLVLIPSVLFELAYHKDALYQSTKGINSISIFESMMDGHLIGTALGSVSLVGGAIVFLFFICYITYKDEKDRPLFMVYMMVVSFFIICFLAPFNVFYRFGIYAPFFAVLLVLYEDRGNMNVFLFTIISYGRAVLSLGYTLNPNIVLTQNWNSKFLMPEIMSGLEGKIQMRATSEMLANVLGDLYFTFLFMIRTVVFAASVILLMINWKGWQKRADINIPAWGSMIVYVSSSAFLVIAFIICILP